MTRMRDDSFNMLQLLNHFFQKENFLLKIGKLCQEILIRAKYFLNQCILIWHRHHRNALSDLMCRQKLFMHKFWDINYNHYWNASSIAHIYLMYAVKDISDKTNKTFNIYMRLWNHENIARVIITFNHAV